MSIVHQVDDSLGVVLSGKAAKTNRVLAVLSSLDVAGDLVRAPINVHLIELELVGNALLEVFFGAVEGQRLEVDVCLVSQLFLKNDL